MQVRKKKNKFELIANSFFFFPCTTPFNILKVKGFRDLERASMFFGNKYKL